MSDRNTPEFTPEYIADLLRRIREARAEFWYATRNLERLTPAQWQSRCRRSEELVKKHTGNHDE